MKKAVIISSVIIAGIAGGIFMHKQALDFENSYMPYSVAYATDGNADKVSANYNNGILDISGLDGKAIVIQASYDKNGVLTDVKLNEVENGENKIIATAGDRLYIWESLDGMRPLWVKIAITEENEAKPDTDNTNPSQPDSEIPSISPGEIADGKSEYMDKDGVKVIIPDKFRVSEKLDEQTVSAGLVIIGPDESEYVWIPTTTTPLAVHDFGSYFSGGGSLSGYSDETDLETYQAMTASVEQYGGFYIGRYEASKGDDGLPVSKRITDSDNGKIWVQFSPQDTTLLCEKLYADNDTVQGFFPWGINWDTTLQWLIDSGCKTEVEIVSDSTSWGNYSNDSFSEGARGNLTGQWEEAKANNIYDLAGNNWEWTQERYGTSYVMRGGGYNLMGGDCRGDRYPAAVRDPLPGNDHHPNVTFRTALYVK